MKKESSTRNKGEGVNPNLLEKTMVSGRVPKYVTAYAKTREISISDLIMAGFDRYRENDVEHASERLSYHENRVLHWRRIVLQHDNDCITKAELCNTIKKTFIENGRGSPDQEKLDKNWLIPRVKKLQAEGIPINVDELYHICITTERTK